MVPSTVIYFYQYGSFMGHPHPFWQRPEWRNWGCKVACRWAAVGRLEQLNQLTLYMRCVSLEELSHQQSELTSWPAWRVHGFQLVFTHIKLVKETSFKPRAKTESCSLLFFSSLISVQAPLCNADITSLSADITLQWLIQHSRTKRSSWEMTHSQQYRPSPPTPIPPSYPLCHLPLLIPPSPSYLIPLHLWMHWYLFVFWWSITAGWTHKKPKQSHGYRISPCALMQPKSAQAQNGPNKQPFCFNKQTLGCLPASAEGSRWSISGSSKHYSKKHYVENRPVLFMYEGRHIKTCKYCAWLHGKRRLTAGKVVSVHLYRFAQQPPSLPDFKRSNVFQPFLVLMIRRSCYFWLMATKTHVKHY